MISRVSRRTLVPALLLLHLPAAWAAVAAPPQGSLDLAAARPLAFERLGQPIVSMRTAEYVLPKADGKGWYAIICYGVADRTPMSSQVYVVDLDTGSIATRKVPQAQGIMSYLPKFACGVDGKYYIPHEGNDFGLWRFDPAAGVLDWVAFPDIKERYTGYSIQASPDRKKIYLGTASRNSLLIEFDPTTAEFRNLGVQGPAKPAPVYIYSMAVEDDYVYMAVRKQPWYLVAANRRTGEQKVLLEADNDIEALRLRDKECYAGVTVRRDPRAQRFYRLENGQAREIPEVPLPKSYTQMQRLRLDGHLAFPYSQHLASRPEVVFNLARPDHEGKANLWWRNKGGEWRCVQLAGIQTKPWELRAIKALADGRLLIAPTEYEDYVLYDPKDRRFTRLGKSPLSTYRLERSGDKVFLMGYPGGVMFEYDPTKAWTYYAWSQENADSGRPRPQPNPVLCQRWSEGLMPVHHIRASAIGADGFIYIGAHSERVAVGGGLGWWDPASRKAGALREPYFLQQDIAGMCAAQDAKKIVYSGRPVSDPRTGRPAPTDAKLYVLDTATKTVTAQIVPAPGMGSCGAIAAAGDRVYGFGAKEHEVIQYIVDLPTGATIKAEPLVGVNSARFGWARGPDGLLYTVLDNRVLARISPTAAKIDLLGDLEYCSNFDFLGRDLYFIGPPGGTTLCRASVVRE